MIVLGYALLTLLASTSLSILRTLLGTVIIVSSLQLIRRSSALEYQSHGIVFIIFGAFGGIMGGLFSTAGPPLVFQFYRQPLPHRVIRETLVAIFSLNSLFRLGLVAANGDWHNHALLWTLAGLPAVLVSTYLARRWPPALSARNMRLVVFVAFCFLEAPSFCQMLCCSSCLVAEHHWDEVGWAIAENAWRFETMINEAL